MTKELRRLKYNEDTYLVEVEENSFELEYKGKHPMAYPIEERHLYVKFLLDKTGLKQVKLNGFDVTEDELIPYNTKKLQELLEHDQSQDVINEKVATALNSEVVMTSLATMMYKTFFSEEVQRQSVEQGKTMVINIDDSDLLE